jgi:hypothetical protein
MMPEYIYAEDKNGKRWKLHLTYEASEVLEHWTFAINDQFLVWRSDRPLVRKNGSRKQPKWQLVKPAVVKDARFLANVLDEIKQIVKRLEGNGPEAQIEYTRTKKSH